ncbi:MAG: hypothetical protein EON58_02775 [Alphaproteobacteria bacterium]|nr:MAG: hypothetical protein EON58_02775 [Alphaproteobacteria bacterium]
MNAKALATTVSCAAFLVAGIANAADCEKLISFSKLTNDSVYSANAFDNAASNYCRDYSTSRASSSTSSANVGYGPFTFGGSTGGVRNKMEAEKVCKASDTTRVRDDAYRNYAETIAPGAYDAYSKCLTANTGVGFGEAVTLSREASITVNFTPRFSGQKSRLTASGMGGASCTWYEAADRRLLGEIVELDSPRTVQLQCNRPEEATTSFVRIYDTLSGGGLELVLPWNAFKDGHPHSTFDDLQAQLAALSTANNELRSQLSALAAKNYSIALVRTGDSGWNGPNTFRRCPDGQVLTSIMTGQNEDFRYGCSTVSVKVE